MWGGGAATTSCHSRCAMQSCAVLRHGAEKLVEAKLGLETAQRDLAVADSAAAHEEAARDAQLALEGDARTARNAMRTSLETILGQLKADIKAKVLCV